jgi:urea transport system permease protein
MTNVLSRTGPGWAARLACALLLLTGPWTLAAQGQGLADALNRLADRSFPVKQEALQAIAASGDPRALAILKALRDGELQVRSEDQRVVVARKSAAGLRLTDPLSGDDLGEADAGSVKKIAVNNTMRTALRGGIAALTLESPDPGVRLSAARELIGSADPAVAPALRVRLGQEDDPAVTEALTLALGIADLSAPD